MPSSGFVTLVFPSKEGIKLSPVVGSRLNSVGKFVVRMVGSHITRLPTIGNILSGVGVESCSKHAARDVGFIVAIKQF
jgi:hypothetical protein